MDRMSLSMLDMTANDIDGHWNDRDMVYGSYIYHGSSVELLHSARYYFYCAAKGTSSQEFNTIEEAEKALGDGIADLQ